MAFFTPGVLYVSRNVGYSLVQAFGVFGKGICGFRHLYGKSRAPVISEVGVVLDEDVLCIELSAGSLIVYGSHSGVSVHESGAGKTGGYIAETEVCIAESESEP